MKKKVHSSARLKQVSHINRRSTINHKQVKESVDQIYHEVGKAVIGQTDVVKSLIRAILCDGHVLLEGVPGVAKTLLIKSLSAALGCESKRVQFTVDLLPTDITGIQSYTPGKGFEIFKGPLFTNFILADEINRSPPKTQSALLEAMQEKMVTIARDTHTLPSPFFVMATENPIENSGVYQLPEAQIDRFLFKVIMGYPKPDEEVHILDQNMTLRKFEDFKIKPILNPQKIINLQAEVKKVYASDVIKKYIVDIVNLSRNKDTDFAKYLEYGGSPRASIALFIASKAEALMNGRDYVIPTDVQAVVPSVLRHRLIVNYQAEAEGITTDIIIKQILDFVKVP